MQGIPAELSALPLELSGAGSELTYTYDAQNEHSGIAGLLQDLDRAGIAFKDLQTRQSSLEDIFVSLVREETMNLHAIRAIYRFEMARTWRTILQSIVSPVVSTSLYFVVFGSAIGSRIPEAGGVSYGAFIVPGLVMLAILTQSVSNASFGIYFPKFTGTIYELLSAPVSTLEIVVSYVGAAATKSVLLGLIILATAALFVPLRIQHPIWMLTFLVLTALTFSLLGFIIGIWADGFEKLQFVPTLIITPLAFLGGSFYSIDMLPPLWQKVTLFNPVVYLISGFRWSFYGTADVGVGISLAMTVLFMAICLGIVAWIFKTGWRLKM